MGTFYSQEELANLGLKSYGENVYIGRNVILYHPERLEIGHDVRIDDFTVISGNVKLHNYIHISHFCGLYGGDEGIEMCDYSGLSSKGTIYAVSDDYTGESMTNPMVPLKYRPTLINGKVKICKHGLVGAGSIVLPNVTIHEGASVGSMSLCTKDVEAWMIYVGIPAKPFKQRSKKILELEQQFIEDCQKEE